MRRLIAFIVLTISMLGLVLFNVQGINENLSYSQEFANGTEVLYKISGAGNEETTIDIDNVVSVMGDRLEASGATNYSIQKASDGENNYEVKIVLGSRNSNSVDNILRSVGSSGNFSFYTTDGTDGTDSDPIIPGSAEVLYNYQNQAYIRLEVTSEVQGVINNAKDEVGNSLLVLWQGKTDDLDYTDLADTNYVSETFGMTGEQLQSKVLAVIDLSESSSDDTTTSSAYDPHRVWKTTTGESEGIDNSTFTVEGEGEDARYYLTFAAYGYAANTESTILMNAESAHSFERMFNQKSLSNYEITEVYRRSYTPEYGSDAVMWMNVTFIVSTLLVCIFLLVSYGFMAISGAIGVALTALADMFILNLFGFIVNPITIISIVVTFGFAVNMLCVYYRRIKEEVYLGRVISKASAEGFRKTISTAVDTTVIFLVLGIVLSLLSRQSIQNFALFFVFSSLLNVILVFLVSRILNHFLFNSKLETKHKLYRINDKYINDDFLNLDRFNLRENNAAVQSSKTRLASTIVLAGEYGFFENKLAVGAIYTTRFVEPKTQNELTFSATYRPKNWFNAAISYSPVQAGGKSLGLGLKLGSLFLGTDYMFFGNNSKSVNGFIGISIPLGAKKSDVI